MFVSPRIKLFKKLLSYFVDIPLVRTKSQFNPDLQVLLSNNRLKLVTSHAVYSYDDRYTNFYEAFKNNKDHLTQCKTCLVLGLGLGSIPYILEKKLQLQLIYDLVEIDEVVVELFKKFNESRLISDLKIHTIDASEFLMNSETKYDLICMDVFQDSLVPTEFNHVNFVTLLKKKLNDRGLVIYNRIAETSEDVALNSKFDEEVFSKIFPKSKILKLEANWMFMGYY